MEGESKRTQSAFNFNLAMQESKDFRLITAKGSEWVFPLVTICRFLKEVPFITDSRDDSCRINSEKPFFSSTLKILWIEGRLKFVSTTSTLSPSQAKTVAKWARTVELPSPPVGLTNRMDRIFRSGSILTIRY